MPGELAAGRSPGETDWGALWSPLAVDRWPGRRAVLRALGRRDGGGVTLHRVLMPYSIARYRVEAKSGRVAEGLTAINAALDPYPEDLSQALTLFRPKLVKMERTPAKSREARVISPSGRDHRLLIEKVAWWLSELSDEMGELESRLRAASREVKRSILIPGSPSLARADRELRDYLRSMRAKREAFNLLFGLPWGEEVEKVEVEPADRVYQRVWVVLPADGPPLVVEAEGRGRARLDEGLCRLLASSDAASSHVLSSIRGVSK